MSGTWKTKWGPRRVRHDPPTLAEAIAAAQGLTDDVRGQIEIAAELMGISRETVRTEMQRLAPDRRSSRLEMTVCERGARTFVVERKASRRVLAREVAGRPGSRPSSARR